jgi:hypothetical protein
LDFEIRVVLQMKISVAEKEISEDGHFQLEGVLQGMKSEAAAGRNAPQVPAAETQNEEGQGIN